MTALEELKSSTRDSIDRAQRELSHLIEESEDDEELQNQIRDIALDLVTEARTIYKVTVAEVRAADSIEEVAKLWQETHVLFKTMLSVWQEVDAMLGRPGYTYLVGPIPAKG